MLRVYPLLLVMLGFIDVFILNGCGVTYPDGKFQCGANGECPSGLYCVENICRRTRDTDVVSDTMSSGADDNAEGMNRADSGQGDTRGRAGAGSTPLTGKGGLGANTGGRGGVARPSGGAGGKGRGGAGAAGSAGGGDKSGIKCVNEICTDNATGLEWQKCSVGQSGGDCSGKAESFTWQQAIDTCQALNSAGQGWRLPSIYELVSIVDHTKYNPPINTSLFPATPLKAAWSSTPYAANANLAWGVNFSSGYVGNDVKSPTLSVPEMVASGFGNPAGDPPGYHARCVRGELLKVGNLINDMKAGDLLVKDQTTSLIWQGCSAGQSGVSCSDTAIPYAWQEATEYCKSSPFAGYHDWRLPTIQELISIVDYTQVFPAPAIDATKFPATPATMTPATIMNSSPPEAFYWSSTRIANLVDHAWFVSFAYGNTKFQNDPTVQLPEPDTSAADITNRYLVRCVRKD